MDTKRVVLNREKALEIHKESVVIDSHNDTLGKVVDDNTWLPKVDIKKSTDFHIDIKKLNQGGLNTPFFAAYTEGYYDDIPKGLSRTLSLINALHWTERENLDIFKIVRSESDIIETFKEKKIAAVSTIEGGYSFNKDNAIELLKQYYDLGVRALGFTWNFSNELGEGAKGIYGDKEETPSPKGLTDLGKELAKEMNRLGMVIDVSHMSEESYWDTINVSKAPIIASHSGVYNLKNHNRNLKDDQLKALGKNGGVVGVVLYPTFLTNKSSADIKDFVDHIDYIVELIGIDHVGLGSDFDGARMPEDLKDSSEFYKITEELLNREYSREDIEKILGKNMLRVLKQVEELSERAGLELDSGLNIIPEYKMGQNIAGNTPLLLARIESDKENNIEESTCRVIINGVAYKGEYDEKDSTLHYQVNEALIEKFNVVTFEIANKDGVVEKNTRIFYIE